MQAANIDGIVPKKHTPHAIVIALSPIARDPRVLRQCQALAAEGWAVTAVGYECAQPHRTFDDWRLVTVREQAPQTGVARRLLRLLRLTSARLGSAWALGYYWSVPNHQAIAEAVAGTREAECDLVIANDWNALPIAVQLAKRCGAKLAYDSHEFAVGERADQWRWRLLYAPYVAAIERKFIDCADWVTAVSGGIANLLASMYPQAAAPRVIRNLPQYQSMPFRPTGTEIDVLYHGIVIPGRGLESLILSVPLWRPEFRLTIRGPVDAAYLDSLRSLAAPAEGRITFAPGVTIEEMVPAANRADIGVFYLPDTSKHNALALPNKLFEYIMAGLAVSVTALPEMKAIVSQYQVGSYVANPTPELIAAAINAFTRESVDRFKHQSLEAAKTLCWDQERRVMLDLYGTAIV